MGTIRHLSAILLLLTIVGCGPLAPAAPGSPAAPQAANPQGVTAQAATTTSATPRTISTSGNAQVMVVPDEVLLTLGVETSDLQLSAAKAQNDIIVAKVLKVTRDVGIDAKYVQTDYLSIEPRYEDSYKQRTFLGYWVRKSVAITLKDVNKFEGLLSQCLEAGVNYVQGIEFRTTELRKYRDQARSLAIKASQEKATALAKELGQGIGQPLSINEDYSRWYSPWNSWWGSGYGRGTAQNTVQNAPSGASEQIDSGLALGQIAVEASVTVEFELR